MSAALDMSRLPDWPRMMSRAVAAAYVGVSENHFAAHFPIQPVRLGKRKLYDKSEIDSYLDNLSGRNDDDDWAETCELG